MFAPTLTANLPFAAFAVSVLAGLFFIGWWLLRRQKYPFLLLWGAGFLLLFFFKLPSVFLHASLANFSQEQLDPFLFLSLILYFVAFFALSKGFSRLRPVGSGKGLFEKYFPAWLAAAVIYFFLSLFFPGADITYAPVWGGHLLFFIPAQVLLFLEIRQLMRQLTFPVEKGFVISAMIGTVLLFVTSVQYIVVQVAAVKRSFWYFAAISSWEASLVQVIAGVFLFIGLFGIARAFLKTRSQSVAAV